MVEPFANDVRAQAIVIPSDIGVLRSQGLFIDGQSAAKRRLGSGVIALLMKTKRMSWSLGEEAVGSINYEVSRDNLVLRFRYRRCVRTLATGH
jgi:hypothetical protein